MKFLLILLLAFPVVGQPKIYVVTDAVRSTVAKEVRLVEDAKDAEIFLEYTTLFRERSDAVVAGLLIGTFEGGELTAYRMRDKEKVVIWTEKGYGTPYGVPRKLASQFRSFLKKSSKK